jgi:Cu2+-exporting ATPase
MFVQLLFVGGGLYAGIIKAYRFKQSRRINKTTDLLPETKIKRAIKPYKITSQEINRGLALSVALTGVAGAGMVGSPLLSLITIPGFLYLSFPFIKRGYQYIKQRRISVDTVVMLAIITTLGVGSASFIFFRGFTYITYYLAEKLRLKVLDDTNKQFIDVFKQTPRFVWVQVDNAEIKTPIDDLKKGVIVIIHAGEVIPVDGIITAGTASIDQKILTGESQLTEKAAGDEVFAATIVLSGRIYIKVNRAGQETTVAHIGNILNNITDYKSKTQLRAEELVAQTAMPTILLSAVTLPFLGVTSAISILLSHYGYGMRLVAPVTTLSYFKLLYNNKLLVKDGRTLDLLTDIDTIVFDKTGTLTLDQPHVGKIYSCANYSEADVLTYAATAEQKQTHPIARAILREAEHKQIEIKSIETANYQLGHGIIVQTDGHDIHLGSERFIKQFEMEIPDEMIQHGKDWYHLGHSYVMLAVDSVVVGMIELKPTLRPEAKTIIRQLRQRQQIKEMYIISGDHSTPTQKLADDLGMDHYFAETLPEQKAALIEQLQADGKSVCFIGDGINDSIALKKAHVSISLKGASSVATDSAQIVMMDGELRHLPMLFDISDKFHKSINTGFLALSIPSLLSMAGVVFLQFGVLQAVVISSSGFGLGLLNGLRPRLHSGAKKNDLTEKEQLLKEKQSIGQTTKNMNNWYEGKALFHPEDTRAINNSLTS